MSMTDREERIRAAVKSVAAQPDAPFAAEDQLFQTGLLDSFALPDLVAALEQEFGIQIPDADLRPAVFGSVDSIAKYIERRTG
jgi:acyl carrier protein